VRRASAASGPRAFAFQRLEYGFKTTLAVMDILAP
jgi:hypothetical protein